MNALGGAVQARGDELPAAAPDAVRPLPASAVDPATVLTAPVAAADGAPTVEELLARVDTRGLVVVHRGRLVAEWYAPGRDPATRRPCFSVTKSFTGTLAAMAVAEGTLDRDAPVRDVLPDLAGSGFADATVGQLADMTVSLAYTEDYTDAGDGAGDGRMFGFNDYIDALDPATPSTLRGLLARIPTGSGPHGEVFAYATPCSDVLGWILERTLGRDYADVLGERVWVHVGAEHGAALGRSPEGVALAGAGLQMSTRDLARCGLALAEGVAVPPAVLASMAAGDPAPFARSQYASLGDLAYRDQWWLPHDPGTGRPLSAWGIHGQVLWIDPAAALVVATHAGGPEASSEARDRDQLALCATLTTMAQDWGTP